MIAPLGALIVVMCAWLTGRALLPSRERCPRTMWEEQALAYLAGAAALLLSAMGLTWAGLAFDTILAWGLLVAGALFGGLRLRRDRHPQRARCEAWSYGLPTAILLGLLALGSIGATLAFPINEFDPLFHFAYKGKILYYTGNPLDEAFTGIVPAEGEVFGRIQTHPNYPLGVPFLEAFAAHAGFEWNDRWVQFPLAFWAACLPALLSFGLRRRSNAAGRWAALIVACTPLLYVRDFLGPQWEQELAMAGLSSRIVLGGGGDLPLACLFGGACALLLRARADRSRRVGLLAGLLLAGAVMMKNEGLGMAGVLTLAILIGSPLAKPRVWAVTLLALLGAGLFSAPWLLHRQQLPAVDENYTEMFTLERVRHFLSNPEDASAAPEAAQDSERAQDPPLRPELIAQYFAVELTDVRSWGLLWLLLLLSLPIGRAFRDADARWLALLVLGGLLLYALIMLVTPWWLSQLRQTGIPERLMLHLIGPTALLIGLRLGQRLEPAATESVEASAPRIAAASLAETAAAAPAPPEDQQEEAGSDRNTIQE